MPEAFFDEATCAAAFGKFNLFRISFGQPDLDGVIQVEKELPRFTLIILLINDSRAQPVFTYPQLPRLVFLGYEWNTVDNTM